MKLFGFTIGRDVTKVQPDSEPALALPNKAMDDGAVTITANAHYGTYVDLEGSVRNELELISRYREMSNHPELEMAIDEIVNEAITRDQFGEVVDINMDKLNIPENIKRKIADEFSNIQKMLNFKSLADDLFKRWYIDGRLFYQVLVDANNPKNGISELRYIDPRKIRKVREINKDKDPKTGAMIIKSLSEYYVYSDVYTPTQNYTASVNTGVKISPDSILNVNSGLMDAKNTFVISFLHKCIKPLNQLRMIEDAVVIYRLARSPERRIFYIDVGNLPKGKAEQYLRDTMIKYKNKMVYDASTGELRDDRKHLCLSMDTKVPLLDGRTLTLSEISKEYSNKKLWAYSCNPITGEFAPGLITWAGVSIKNAKVMRITLDNGREITCTPDHKFPVWNKGLVCAKDLLVGDSMIPLYKREKSVSNGANKNYEQIFNNDKKEWNFTHRLVSTWKDLCNIDNLFIYNEQFKDGINATTVHHKNFNRFDNTPDNLARMHNKDHWFFHRSSGSGSGKIGGKRAYEMGVGFHNKLHPDYKEWHIKAGKAGGSVSSILGKSQENREKGRKILSELLKDPEFNQFFRSRQREGWTQEKKEDAGNRAKTNKLSSRGNAAKQELFKDPTHRAKHEKKYKTEYTESMISEVSNIKTSDLSIKNCLNILNSIIDFNEWKELNINKVGSQKNWNVLVKEDLFRIVNILGFKSWSEFKDSKVFRNHKVVSIELLDNTMDVGCLTIDGNEEYHNYHTFALDAGIYTQNSMLEDFWLPRREGGKGTEITTLPSGQNLGEMADVDYFRKKLLNSLNVPISRLEPQDGGMIGVGRSTEVTRDEVKFSKFIQRLRVKFSRLFDDALGIQLALKGICSREEWEAFKEDVFYDYKKDNNFTELRDAELLRERLQTLEMVEPYIGKYFSITWTKKNILKQTDEQIEKMYEEMVMEDEQGLTSLAQDQEMEKQDQAEIERQHQIDLQSQKKSDSSKNINKSKESKES